MHIFLFIHIFNIKPRLKASLQRLFLLSVFLLVVSCAQSPVPPPEKLNLNSQAHQLSLKRFSTWSIQGKLGFKSPEKKQSARFNWQQEQKHYTLNLTSIIGTSLLKMSGDLNQVELKNDGKTYQDTDASFLIWRMTGWQIPVEHFPEWVKGLHQAEDQIMTAAQGWVTQIKPSCDNCDGWVVNYSDYQKVQNIWLPHKIVLINQNTSSQLLIRVNSWS